MGNINDTDTQTDHTDEYTDDRPQAGPFRILDQRPETVDIDSIQPHEKNVNVGDIDAISESMDEHGFFGRVLVREATRKIIAGKHRWDTAKLKGATVIPVEFVDCDEETALRIMLADNETARKGKNDERRLTDLLAELSNSERGLAGTGGYTESFLDKLIGDMAGAGGGHDGDTTAKIADKMSTSKSAVQLKFGKHTIPLTEAEVTGLEVRLKEHTDETGTHYGFIADILGLSV